MDCFNNQNVCSVKKENNLGYYRLHTIWKDDSFRINIASKDAAWSGEMGAHDVKRMGSQLQLDSNAYLKDCKEALTTNNGKPGVSYSVENGSFVWKKMVDEDAGIQLKMGSIRLEPVNFVETIQSIVNVALECNNNLQNQISELNKEKEKLNLNNTKLMSALEDAKNIKMVMETDLYSKFLLLLNSKKEKILELENLLQANNISKRTIKPEPVRKRKTQAKKKITDSEAYDVDTESDNAEEEKVKKNVRNIRRSKNITTVIKPVSNSFRNVGNKRDAEVTENSNSVEAECSEAKKSKDSKNIPKIIVENKANSDAESSSDATISDESLLTLQDVKIPSKVKDSNQDVLSNGKKNLAELTQDNQDLLSFFYG